MSYLTLVLDTTIQGVAMALVDSSEETKPKWQSYHLDRNGSAKSLSKTLSLGLKEVSASMQDIKKITIAVGPGTFTGIKVGISWAAGLFAASDEQIQVMGVSSLKEIARLSKEKNMADSGLSVLLKGTRTHGYKATASSHGEVTAELISFENEAEKKKCLNALSDEQIILIGDWPLFAEIAEEESLNYFQIELGKALELSIAGMVKSLSSPEACFNQKVPDPIYLRKSTAEEKLAQRSV